MCLTDPPLNNLTENSETHRLLKTTRSLYPKKRSYFSGYYSGGSVHDNHTDRPPYSYRESKNRESWLYNVQTTGCPFNSVMNSDNRYTGWADTHHGGRTQREPRPKSLWANPHKSNSEARSQRSTFLWHPPRARIREWCLHVAISIDLSPTCCCLNVNVALPTREAFL
ncbi:hypothetical protein BD779DRAFT_1159573 [Infundibulicybe gibba]|nr:hypothetical protein BD779DRAFT_1159573 [Infundibulicybe gibba]